MTRDCLLRLLQLAVRRHESRGRARRRCSAGAAMTPDDARERIEAIKGVAGDWEQTHSLEDDLWEAALQSIAEGSCDDPAELARVTLHSRDLDYTRWYA